MVGLTHVSQGTITTDGTEQNIVNDGASTLQYNMIKIFVDAMASGDKITIRIYDWDIVAAAYKISNTITLQDAQSSGAVGYIPPLPQYRFKVTIQRTAGTDRAYNWERLSN